MYSACFSFSIDCRAKIKTTLPFLRHANKRCFDQLQSAETRISCFIYIFIDAHLFLVPLNCNLNYDSLISKKHEKMFIIPNSIVEFTSNFLKSASHNTLLHLQNGNPCSKPQVRLLRLYCKKKKLGVWSQQTDSSLQINFSE